MARGELATKTIHELASELRAGRLVPLDIVEDVLWRIECLNPALSAYLEVVGERLRGQARALTPPWRGRLAGIPITVKDNICIAGEATGCASRILEGFRPPYDATVIERLRHDGALLIPRANMDEFAFGSSTENSAYGPARNPWTAALDRVPGGSSGGSAVAVAADLAVAALGSDTGGSIRQPASFCGVVGLKPTYGRVSRYGLVAFASSLDQIGPLTKDVRDAAILLTIIAGHDARDSTSAPVEVPDYEQSLEAPPGGVTIGVVALEGQEGVEAAVRQALEEAAETLRQLGMRTVPVTLPSLRHAVATYYVIATAEASSNLARYDGVQYGFRMTNGARRAARGIPQAPEVAGHRPPAASDLVEMYLRTRTDGFGAEAKRRILLGTYVLSQGYYEAYYLQGLKVRTLIKRDFDDAFRRCDALLLPTSPTPAFRLGEKVGDPLTMYLSDIFTISANLAGVPAISVPCGFTAEGLPIGMQLLAAPFQEAKLLQVAFAYEQATAWHRRQPPLSIAS
jgi:aspartyl-tRNA(Asn)/glutamyl-tRNA(Gln) amidotransferase subunit A